MIKKLNIIVKIDTTININSEADLTNWNEAKDESKNYYIKERVKEYMLENIDLMVDDLLENSKITF